MAEHSRMFHVRFPYELRTSPRLFPYNSRRIGAFRLERQKEVEQLGQHIAQANEDLSQRERSWDVASTILEGLRESSIDIVRRRLIEIEEILQGIYARMDPHPSFRTVSLLTQISRGRGRLSTRIEDRQLGINIDSPGVYLSSSQLNVLAVSIFLALNLGVQKLPLDCVILDDPLQSLDDVNLLGLTDMLRRLKQQRQLIISTHDDRLSNLLERKLRPIRPLERTLVVEFLKWDREGPELLQRVLSPGEKLRIVA